VRAFHQAYYRPDNAALIVVGNFDQAQLDAWIDQYFAPLKTPAAPIKQVTVVEPARTGPKVVTTYGPNVPLPAVAITWLAPAAADKDVPALAVLDAILSAGKSSRLYDSLVYDQKIAQSIFSSAPEQRPAGPVLRRRDHGRRQDVEQGEARPARPGRQAARRPAHRRRTGRGQGRPAGRRRARPRDHRRPRLRHRLRPAHRRRRRRANTDLAALQAVTAADVQRVAAKYLADDRRT
jgi:zinc protease